MFILDYFKKWFRSKSDSTSTNVDPLAAAALTTNTSSDRPLPHDTGNPPEKDLPSDDGFDSSDSDFDFD
jgi:hypothetical protein